MVNIVVDGETFSVDKNGNLITELKKHNIEIPHFCYHEALGVSGNCRMCLIEVVGQKRPQIACNTPISEGMEIKINSELTRKVQKGRPAGMQATMTVLDILDACRCVDHLYIDKEKRFSLYYIFRKISS